MKNKDLGTKEIILKAAEDEFLEKGYGGAKMMSIAKRAGVSHSMLHYYFASKENLFQMIFSQKTEMIIGVFDEICRKNLPFLETIRLVVEAHFDFVAQNPQLPIFITGEIMQNNDNRLLFTQATAKQTAIFDKIVKLYKEEIEKGTVQYIEPIDLIMNILSPSIGFFVSLPLFKDFFPNMFEDENAYKTMLKNKKESYVQFVLNVLKL